MELWKIALLLLASVWGLQSVGMWFQMRHYRSVMGAITDKWSDGHLGAGNARGRLGKGVIAIVCVDGNAVIRKLMVMEGRSVFAKFRPMTEYEGRRLSEVKAEFAKLASQDGRARAISQAIDQLERVKEAPVQDSAQDMAQAA
ncbi:transcriptional regulator GutM [Paracoccus onubensis]|uniref:transcriptional regulator GutM n=1 Tax=Paracoccus onubensis TaxID=1675788 RepID=UPI00273032CC|nr:transcriptional regulator GutM [Paracoccus onubensis]MDP0930016.1 transcriptional regulator GutM [Paracoccus onubensis]